MGCDFCDVFWIFGNNDKLNYGDNREDNKIYCQVIVNNELFECGDNFIGIGFN